MSDFEPGGRLSLVVPIDASDHDKVLHEMIVAVKTHQRRYGMAPHTMLCSRRTRDALLHYFWPDAEAPPWVPLYVMGVAVLPAARIPDGELHAYSDQGRATP